MKKYKRIVLYALGFAIVSPMVTVFFNLSYIICWKFYDGITISIILNNLNHYIHKTIEIVIGTYYVFGTYSLFFGAIFGARYSDLDLRHLARSAGMSYIILYLIFLALIFVSVALRSLIVGIETRDYSYMQWTAIVAPFFTVIAGFLSGAIPIFVISKFCKKFDIAWGMSEGGCEKR